MVKIESACKHPNHLSAGPARTYATSYNVLFPIEQPKKQKWYDQQPKKSLEKRGKFSKNQLQTNEMRVGTAT